MFNPLFINAVLLGVQHSFEPDHVAAVSVLATEKNKNQTHLWRLIWRSSHWALGHSFTLIVFAILILLLKATIPLDIAGYVELCIGPIMIGLGISAIRRNRKQVVFPAEHTHFGEQPILSRSFWVGMVHGLAGTGGACALALTLAARDAYTAVWIIVLQSLGIIIAMTAYGCLFAFSVTKFAGKRQPSLKGINYVVGTFSILIGLYCLLESGQALLTGE
jgi:cytochrome c biogenesis protein CcdA